VTHDGGAYSDADKGRPMSPAVKSLEEFEDLVRDAMDPLPEWAAPIHEELAVLVEDRRHRQPLAQGPPCSACIAGFP
jgi:hypothetical protein